MTDAPKFMPHPDDPTPPEHASAPAAPQPVPDQFANVGGPSQVSPPYVAPPLPPSSDQNMLGTISLVVSGISGLMIALQFAGGGIPLLIPLIGGIVGTVFGVKGLNAVRRGTATNRGMALAGAIIGTVTILMVPVYFMVMLAFIAAVVGGAG